MNKKSINNIFLPIILSMLISCFLLLPQTAFAASTVTALLQQNGSGCTTQDGDYVTESNWVYQFYIEVPSGLTRLRVQLFDADIGRGGTGDARDFLSGTWNTACRYILYDPSGTQVATFTGNRTTGTDNGWMDLYNTTSTPIPSGHWRLVTDMTATVTTGDETNGFGIRADDGNTSSAGTELNIYAHPFLPLGRVNSTFYPWATSGCVVDYNDFDGDSTYSVSYSSRTGTFSGSFSGSANNAWRNNSASMANDFYSIDSGLWTSANTLTGSNIITFYTGNYAASNPPPSSQAEANTFRIYFPRDGGGKPSKPVVTQKLSLVSGPNPPINDSTTRVRVEIAVFNPAAQAITFSAGKIVTAYVPGNGVVYAGNAIVSQGSVTTPAVGGIGAVSWNPGAVAGNNSYATLTYVVDVTPTAATGPRYPVTGAPGANGTTAVYVDETGNTTQAQATYTYGPLCELAVTRGGGTIPTWVAISCFEADMTSGQPTVEWHTSAENGTVGFYLWRQDSESKDYQLVNPNFLPALTNAMTGGVYRLVDPGVQYGEKVVYRLTEVDARGAMLNYGPFTVVFDSVPASFQEQDNFYKKKLGAISTPVRGFQSAPFMASEYEKNRQLARRSVLLAKGKRPATQSGIRAKIAVKSRGLFHIDAVSIAAALGMSATQVEGLIAARQLSLSNLGEAVAWLADATNAGIYFYGENPENPYSDQNVYWLEQGSGLALATVNGGTAAAADPGQTFNEIKHYEENHYPLTSLFTKADDDFWLWDIVVAGAAGTSFNIQVPGRAAAGTATLTVNLQGATDTAAANDHHVQVSLNGTQIGEDWWDGLVAHTCQFTFNQSLLNDGNNTIIVNGVLDGGVTYSYFYVDSFDLSYQRYYQAVNNTLLCQGDANQTVSVIGISDSQFMVWDVSQPKLPKLVSTDPIDPGGHITFIPAAPANKYLLVGLSAALQPFSVNGSLSADLRQSGNSAEYLLIAPQELASEARQLADYRSGQGLTAKVVTLEDIYDSFNWGLASPLAIRNFLNYAFLHWSGKGLKYGVMVGRGTFDYKNYLGYGDNLVPPILASTPDGLFAADNLYGDTKGNDGIPDIAIGRLPVVSVAELHTVIGKIKTYGSSQGPWTGQALMAADNADSGGDFISTSETLIKQLKNYTFERIYLLDNYTAAEARLKIIAGFNAGAALFNYVGHAGLDQLAEENIFNISDLPLLQNGSNLPVMVLVACVAGRFDIPGYACLTEALLLKDNGGIVTALAPSGASFNAQANLLVEELYKAFFSHINPNDLGTDFYRGKANDLGTVWLKATRKYVQTGGNPDILNIYNLIGDPAVMFK